MRVRGEVVYIWTGRDRRACRRRSMALIVLLTVATAGLVACTSHNTPVSPGTNAGSSSAGATASAQRAPYDLTRSPFFQTPDGNIKCGLPGFRWWSDQPAEPASVSQAVDCRIGKHSVPPADCSNSDSEESPGVYMPPSEYASFTCLGMQGILPMYSIETSGGSLKSRSPYRAHAGQIINLGPVTCSVGTGSVECTSSDGKHRFHLDRASFRSPLNSADAVLAAENPGGAEIKANTGAVKPAKYLAGKDSSLSDISWSKWNANLAVGSAAIYQFNTCQPDCAAASYRTDHNVIIKFTDPKIVCGMWFFTEVSVNDAADSQGGGQLSIAPDTDARGYQCLPPSNG